MSQLTIYSAVSDGENPPLPSLHTTDAAIVAEELEAFSWDRFSNPCLEGFAALLLLLMASF